MELAYYTLLGSWALTVYILTSKRGSFIGFIGMVIAFGAAILSYLFMPFVTAPQSVVTILLVVAFFNGFVMFALVLLMLLYLFMDRKEKKKKKMDN